MYGLSASDRTVRKADSRPILRILRAVSIPFFIYKPSYVSTHAALAFYGIIPEASVRVTAVSPLKTMDFTNSIGTFSYQKVKPSLFFGSKRLSERVRLLGRVYD